MQTCRYCQSSLRDDLFNCPHCRISTDESVDLNQAIRDRDLADIARTARAIYTILMVQAVLAAVFFVGVLWLGLQGRRLLF